MGLLCLLIKLMISVLILELWLLVLLLQGSNLCLLTIHIWFQYGYFRHERVILFIQLGNLWLELLFGRVTIASQIIDLRPQFLFDINFWLYVGLLLRNLWVSNLKFWFHFCQFEIQGFFCFFKLSFELVLGSLALVSQLFELLLSIFENTRQLRSFLIRWLKFWF